MTDNKNSTANRLGLKVDGESVSLDRNSVLGAIGGPLGIAESIAPSMVFVLLIVLTSNTLASVIGAVAVSLVFLGIQIARKRPITQAIAGLVGIAISAMLPLRSGGQAADYFVQGFFTNAIYLSVLLISILIRWPVIGILAAALTSTKGWRADKVKLRKMTLATSMWVGLFGARLLVQLPLYFAGQVELLGIFRILMGVPLYALCIWFTWLIIRPTLRPAS